MMQKVQLAAGTCVSCRAAGHPPSEDLVTFIRKCFPGLRNSSREYSDKKRALRRVTQVSTYVNADHAEQKKNHVKIREELENTKIKFMLPEHSSRGSMNENMFCHCCFLPRCVFSVIRVFSSTVRFSQHFRHRNRYFAACLER
eukprot:3365_1